ncbi:hypothetical protein AURDEDRAFT_175440 [Auricularia subglabra TFB-10046 SS5]|uniref:MYND-type domain-containing protein n=1 Tax=Auricularia subglabra (strain TFB-10046 / SS5) TaxID=717982 RepID=J0LF03_AURST|nr:hypothetical protein AURDEDRAFT_175440 [Auricularia subglabra TFB-10046 SS5]
MASRRELLRDAEAVASGLNEPQAPTACFSCLANIGSRLAKDDSATKFLAINCRPFFTGLTAFLAQDWTESRRALASPGLWRTGDARCQKCNPRNMTLEQCAFTDPPFVSACNSIYMVMRSALKDWVNDDKGNPFANRRGRWPTSPEELFPSGPYRTISGLLTLVEAGMNVDEILVILIAVHRPLAFSGLSSTGNRARFISLFVTRMRTAASAIASDVAKLRLPVIPTVRDRVAQRHIESFERLATTLLCVFSHPDHSHNGPSFIRGHETELYTTLTTVINYLEDPLSTHSRLASLAHLIWHCLSVPQLISVGGLNPPWYIRAIDEEIELEFKDPYRALRFSLLAQTTRRGCHGRDCRRPIHEKATSGTFALCASCTAVTYCSRDCQRADWTHPSYPHKDVCDALRSLFAFADMHMSKEQFADACRAHEFPLGRVDKLIEWASNRDGHGRVKVVSDFENGRGMNDVVL